MIIIICYGNNNNNILYNNNNRNNNTIYYDSNDIRVRYNDNYHNPRPHIRPPCVSYVMRWCLRCPAWT